LLTAEQESHVESLRWVIRARWVVLLLVTVLVSAVEWVTPGPGRNLIAWVFLLVEACFNLVYGFASSYRRAARILLTAGFLTDGAVLSVYVALSGGAVSVNITYLLIILMTSSLVQSPRMIAGVGVGVVVMFVAAMRVSYDLHIAALVPAQNMNPFWLLLDSSPEETRRLVFQQQTIRWVIWMAIVTIISAFLSRRIGQREEHLREQERSIDQQRRLLQMGELAGRLAHSLNTPLGLISGNLEMLLKKAKRGTELHKDLTRIMEFVHRAVKTLEDVLAYNRQSLSQIRDIDVPGAVRDVVEAVKPRLERKQGRMILDLKEGMPPLRGYPEAFHQALLNLVENAVDALEEGGTVAVEARFDPGPVRLSAQDDRGDIRIIVRDNGKGVPAQEIRRIFEPFFTTKEVGRGTGLGLPIVKRIMEEHGGQVKAERNVEKGMKFTMVFPSRGKSVADREGLPVDFFER
jgi:signal transduction histidine kinase